MEDVTLAHAKEHLEDLVRRAAAGEDVRISDPAIGTVKLTLAEMGAHQKPKRIPGRLTGVYSIPDGLFELLPEDELKRWTGEE